MKWSEYVGYRFRAFGNIYKCVKYDDAGLHMELQDESADFPSPRKRGDIACVSERAVGRTYYPIYEY